MNQLKTTFLMAALMGLFLFFGQLLGGQQGLVIAFVLAAGLNFFSYFFSDKIVLKMYKAHEVGERDHPRLYGMVARLAQKAGMPMPRVFIIPSQTPNAFATGRNPKHAVVAATAGIMDLLSDDELEGVMAHELGHVRNRDILISSVVATVAGAIAMLASMVRWAAIFGHVGGGRGGQGNVFGALALAIVAPLMALVIQMAVSRAREFEADQTGAELCGNPLALARALEKIHQGVQRRPMEVTPGREANAHMFIANPFSAKGMIAMLSTHPPVAERVARLEAMVYGRTRP